jgi:hypothetical protein
MISICTAVKNRSRVALPTGELQLFPNCVRSIMAELNDDIPCELVVADWDSDDWPLKQWLPQLANSLPIKIVQLDGGFSRGRGLNAAATFASGSELFFLDSDALVCRKLFLDGLTAAQQGKAYFPVLFSFNSPTHQSGWWRHEGFGHVLLKRELYLKAGGWPEYTKWGKEDDDFVASLMKITEIVREEVPGFYHQWHPEEILWKNRYSADYHHLIQDGVLADEMRHIIRSTVPSGAMVILVDEGRFDSSWLPECTTCHLPERNGIYWGTPLDDRVAIAELDRLRQLGASYIAFGWMSFWWLEYYSGLYQHICDVGRCIFKNDVAMLFRLDTD